MIEHVKLFSTLKPLCHLSVSVLYNEMYFDLKMHWNALSGRILPGPYANKKRVILNPFIAKCCLH